jgi:hypothetical protein
MVCCYFVGLIVIPKLLQSSDVLNYCESCQTEEFLQILVTLQVVPPFLEVDTVERWSTGSTGQNGGLQDLQARAPKALTPYTVRRAPIALAPYSDKRASGLMASWPPSNCSYQNILLHVLFETYFLVTSYVDSFITVLRSYECVKLFFSILIDYYVQKILVD